MLVTIAIIIGIIAFYGIIFSALVAHKLILKTPKEDKTQKTVYLSMQVMMLALILTTVGISSLILIPAILILGLIDFGLTIINGRLYEKE